MIAFVTVLVGLLSVAASSSEWTHVGATAKTGHKVNLDVAMDAEKLIMVTHRTRDADANFVETENLHIFHRRLVAARDSFNKRCFVQESNMSHSAIQGEINLIKEGVKNEVHSFDEEKIILSELTCRPFTSSSVTLLFGDEIATFCTEHEVFFLDKHAFKVVYRSDADVSRQRRQVEVTVQIGVVIKF